MSSTCFGFSQSRPCLAERQRLVAAGFDHRVAGQRGVPHRRDAGLAIGLVLANHQKLLKRPPRDRARRIVRRLAERLIHHDGVGHRRINRAQAVFAVQPFFDERNRRVDRARAKLLRKQRLEHAQHTVQSAEQEKPAPALMRRFRRHSDRMRRLQEQLIDADARGVFRARLQRRQDQQRHDRGARPIRDLVDVERRPHRQQHDLDRQYRHAAPMSSRRTSPA